MFKAKLKREFATIFSVIFEQLCGGYPLFTHKLTIHILLWISFEGEK